MPETETGDDIYLEWKARDDKRTKRARRLILDTMQLSGCMEAVSRQLDEEGNLTLQCRPCNMARGTEG